jgi:ribosomal protein S18 acetylase RimI-like enzyme
MIEHRDGFGATLASVDPTPDDVQYLEDRLYEFNSTATRIMDGDVLAYVVREHGRIVAGICGNTWGGTCEVRQFWVEAAQRCRGIGTMLFRAVEKEARRRGCSQIVLMTFSFQAPAFYSRQGFEIIATIDDHPRGHRNLLMRKLLGQDVHATTDARTATEGGRHDD